MHLYHFIVKKALARYFCHARAQFIAVKDAYSMVTTSMGFIDTVSVRATLPSLS